MKFRLQECPKIPGPMYKAALATGRKALPEPSTIMDFDIMGEIQSGLAKK